MNRYITTEVEDDILIFLREWEAGQFGKKLTWDKISAAFGYSRQALNGNKNIKSAFDRAKLKLKDADNTAATFEDMKKEIQRLNKELYDANHIIELYKQRYIRWQVNAQSRGVSVEQLNKPIQISLKEDMRRKMQDKQEE
ncbi:hypothetical protein E5E96_05545 [Aeromonas sp. 1805]|uniref:hypothetical protein n=1 Tax=Aeromonas sp. 1805 TaxID=2560028 RepID=UPI00148B0843|nr:hypothetical protein [Aeromonas sp. 1805]QJT16796.1 hypothetical protein E5E96_05545 [Aeromonas sp. 1805]